MKQYVKVCLLSALVGVIVSLVSPFKCAGNDAVFVVYSKKVTEYKEGEIVIYEKGGGLRYAKVVEVKDGFVNLSETKGKIHKGNIRGKVRFTYLVS